MRRGFIILFFMAIFSFILYVSAEEKIGESTESIQDTQKEEDIVDLDKMVITATKLEMPLREVASSMSVISSQDIERGQQKMVLDVLRGIPGLFVLQTGGIGTHSQVYIRGAGAMHTLVLVDGVEMNDPTSTGRTFDFAHLTADNIERIEVLRGPQSTLYGSDAMGGVINILTKKGKGKPAFTFQGEGGSYKTFRGMASVNGDWQWLDYSLSGSRIDTKGVSAAGKKYGNTESDGYENNSICGRIGFNPTDNFGMDVYGRYVKSENEIDNFGGAGGDDPNSRGSTQQIAFKTQARLSLLHERWEQKLGLSYTDNNRENINETDEDHLSDSDWGSYDGLMLKAEWQNNFFLHKTNTVTFGVEVEQEKAESEYHSEGQWGPYTSIFKEKTSFIGAGYLQDQIKLFDCFFTTLGVRLDYNKLFGNYTTFRVASAYFIEKLNSKIKATVGTGFKAPSLFQLYSEYGSESLDPEKSVGWDIGVEHYLLSERITFGATYFSNDFRSLIDFNQVTWKYQNVAEAESKGVELFSSIQPINDLKLQINYTYMETENKKTGEALLQRPKNKFNAAFNYRFLNRANVGLDFIYIDERLDFGIPSSVVLDEYKLVNVSVSYDVTKNLSLFSRVNNVLDEEYEEVKGYGTAGTSGYVGFKLSF